MQVAKRDWCCGGNLRMKCFVIGYMNLIASVVDIGLHVLIVSIVTNGFQCDVDSENLEIINWPWLEPILLVINLGTHGFYPFPLVLRDNAHIDYMPIPAQPRCYPGMLHICLIDVLNFLINAIWLRFVVSYVAALHRKDPESMRMFFGLSTVKLVLQVLYFAYQPEFHNMFAVEAYWFIKLMDIFIAAVFLVVINKYIRELRLEKIQPTVDQPPSYIECLINGTPRSTVDEKKIIHIEESKVDVPTEAQPNTHSIS